MTNESNRQAQATFIPAMNAEIRPAETGLPAYAGPVAEQALRTCQTLIEVNRTAADMIWLTARHQQQFAFVVAQIAVSALPGTARHAKDFWSQAAVYGEACGHGIEAMRAIANIVFELPLRSGLAAPEQPGIAGAENRQGRSAAGLASR